MKLAHYLIPSLLVVTAGCSLFSSVPNRPTPDEPFVTVGDVRIAVAIASTDEEKTRGLGGVVSLPDGTGMLFPFNDRASQTFWMKGMLMPIDIIWIDGGAVIGIAKNAPVPPTGAEDRELPLYASPGPISAVLEVSAGYADRAGIAVGDLVSYR